MAQLGKFSTLLAVKFAPQGLYFDGGPLGEILLPKKEVPAEMNLGETLPLFIYVDSEDRPVCTTRKPLAEAGSFALLKVVDYKPGTGAFLDLGLDKHLLLPLREQKMHLTPGDSTVVHVGVDAISQRLVASQRIERFLAKSRPPYAFGQKVQVQVYAETELGYKAIVEGKFQGLIYHSDLNAALPLGAILTAHIHSVRADAKIDLKLDASGFKRIKPLSESILESLQSQSPLAVNDQSSPEDIREAFACSKKAFKQAIGTLFKARKIRIENDQIHRA